MQGLAILLGRTQAQLLSMVPVEVRQVAAASRVMAPADSIGPWPLPLPLLQLLLQLGFTQGRQGAARLPCPPGQQLQMAVGLACPSWGRTVEEPQPGRIPCQMAHGLPVLWPDPARLGLPVLGYQQQVARLHRVLVEQHHMA